MKIILLDNYRFALTDDEEYFDKHTMGIDTSICVLERMLSVDLPKYFRCILYLDTAGYVKFLNNNLSYDGYKVVIYDSEEFDLDEDDLSYFKNIFEL